MSPRSAFLRNLARPLGALLLCGLLALAKPAPAAETVESLRYGASLYYFYQRDYFGALTELTAAQQLDALGPHTDGAELLRGGMSLSYGMDREAERIFREQLTENQDSADADQAWFYLSKMAWQRGETERTLTTLARMTPHYEGPLKPEASYLLGSATLAAGDRDTANTLLQSLDKDSRWHHYLSYNIGAFHAANGDWAQATPYFGAVSEFDAQVPEDFALRDKSLTAQGYSFLTGSRYDNSATAFRQVRLEGPYAERALLGYGWSAAEQGNYLAALSPWQQLAQRSLLDASTRESLLAVPYAYSQLGRPGIALQKYRAASEAYASELAGLEKAISAFEEQPLAPLLGIADEGSADWFFHSDILPIGEHTPYLEHLIAQHSFQVALRELRDLYSVAGHIARAQQRLQVLIQVDTHQQTIWNNLVEENRREHLAQRQQALAHSQTSLRQQLLQAIARQDGRLLAGEEQTALWTRLQRAEGLARNINQASEHADRIRLLRGLLVWEDSEQYPQRAWWARQQLKDLESLAIESVEGLQRVDHAIEGRRASDFAPRIADLMQRSTRQGDTVAKSIAQSEQTLRQVAVAELTRQGEQLRRALGQSQLAIAQLHDQALAGNSGADAYE